MRDSRRPPMPKPSVPVLPPVEDLTAFPAFPGLGSGIAPKASPVWVPFRDTASMVQTALLVPDAPLKPVVKSDVRAHVEVSDDDSSSDESEGFERFNQVERFERFEGTGSWADWGAE